MRTFALRVLVALPSFALRVLVAGAALLWAYAGLMAGVALWTFVSVGLTAGVVALQSLALRTLVALQSFALMGYLLPAQRPALAAARNAPSLRREVGEPFRTLASKFICSGFSM